MSCKVSFFDNQTAGVDDFNAILGDIAQKGIVTEDFDKTEVYQMSKMNTVTKKCVSQGVSADEKSLKCTIGKSGGKDGVFVASGLGIFSNGAKIKVTESEFVECDVQNACVYAFYDGKFNLSGLKAGESFPEEAENEMYVLPLCEIENGVVKDKREYAKAKVRVCDIFNAVTKEIKTLPTKAEHGSDMVLSLAGEKVNFFVFDCLDTMAIVTEDKEGNFVIRQDGDEKTIVKLAKYYDAHLCDFRRNEEGCVVARIVSYTNAEKEYVLYKSVYEEG